MDQQSDNSSKTLNLENEMSLYFYNKKISGSSSKDDDLASIFIINKENENEKTFTNNKLQDVMNYSIDESNKNDINSFFDIQDEVQDTYNNIISKKDYNFMIKNEKYFYLCKFCRNTVGHDSIF